MSIRSIASKISTRAREKRAATFRSLFDLTAETKILDLGAQAGDHIRLVLDGTPVRTENVCIADMDGAAIRRGHAALGYNGIQIDESASLPFADNSFDIVFCSSVIEHVTAPKDEVWAADAGFRDRAFARQRQFADEIRRIGRSFFVQTPNRTFIMESHLWLPFVNFFPRGLLVTTIRFTNRFWPFKSLPDFNLLDRCEMKELFPEAEIAVERKFGLVKSIMAIGRRSN